MLIRDKKQFTLGSVMTVGFFIVFAIMFMPYFGQERNAFEASDDLFNSISKGSTYYIGDLRESNKAYVDEKVELTLNFPQETMREQAKTILSTVAVISETEGNTLTVTGSLGNILAKALDDSDAMFANKSDTIESQYGLGGRAGMYTWWNILNEMEKALKQQELFPQAAHLYTITTKGVEVGYNYYTIEPKKAANSYGILTFTLVFYVVYTLWWGYAIFFLAEGVGLAMKGGAKKEV